MSCKRTAIPDRLRLRACALCALAFGVATTCAVFAHAQALRLRGDALVATQTPETQSPAGLVILQGEDRGTPWIDAEGLVWAGATPDAAGDVLVLAVHVRERHGYGELRVGRFVLATGAVLPVQIDGADAIGRTPWGSAVETFGGIPVVPRFGPRTYDWLAGTRVSQSVLSLATVGLSYEQRREDGEIADEELGADMSVVPVRWLDLAARGSYDLTSPGISDALASLAARSGGWRLEAFASDRSPARLLPATSLFSVLGDFASQSAGGTLEWRAAPRLDLRATGAAQWVGGEAGSNGLVRATLRLDDRGEGSVGVEVRREDVSSAQWTGVRVVAAEPLGGGLRYSTEIEVVTPDHPDGRGVAWPWGLMALSWRAGSGWEVAGALEASSTPAHRYESDALLRLSRALEIR